MSAAAPKAGEPAPAVRHVAIIMDGNGRWAKKRHLPRVVGHQRGVEAVRAIVRAAARLGLEALTLYAFSTGVTFDLSHTCTVSIRGSGADSVATCEIGMWLP